MDHLLESKLVRNYLERLSQGDYLANAILAFSNQRNQIPEIFNSLNNQNDASKKDALLRMQNLTKSSIFLEEMLRKELKIQDESLEISDLIINYILNNINKLSTSPTYIRYYIEIASITEKLKEYFSPRMCLAITLRSIYIMEGFINKGNKDALDNLIGYLKNVNCDAEDEILYNIYYGLFNGEIKEEKITFVVKKTEDEEDTSKIDDEKVYNKLLNSNDTLPDNIIEQLCVDEQFEPYDKGMIILLINKFFMFKLGEKLEDDDMIDIIQKLFNNRVRDFSTKAEFLNLTELLDKINDYFENGNVNDFENDIVDIVIGNNQLSKKENNGYGII